MWAVSSVRELPTSSSAILTLSTCLGKHLTLCVGKGHRLCYTISLYWLRHLWWETLGPFWTRVSGRDLGNLITWGTKVLRSHYSHCCPFPWHHSASSPSQLLGRLADSSHRSIFELSSSVRNPDTRCCSSDSGVSRVSFLLPHPLTEVRTLRSACSL